MTLSDADENGSEKMNFLKSFAEGLPDQVPTTNLKGKLRTLTFKRQINGRDTDRVERLRINRQ